MHWELHRELKRNLAVQIKVTDAASCEADTHTGRMCPWVRFNSPSLKVSPFIPSLAVRPGGRKASVDPADGNPLGLDDQSLHRPLQRVKGLVQIVVDDRQVKVVAVRPTDPGALVHSLLQIVLRE